MPSLTLRTRQGNLFGGAQRRPVHGEKKALLRCRQGMPQTE
ncbi:hypothetical protein PU630_03105 [Microbacterium horticulturae]|uniref:Uncharacterized protein n=1 Tax=Microbacterium horticulturae TaxID=3028316 RepID=A0ABY8C2W2_9MICO|nr:hypothetical protein [Microbacterium sp. KACC 23027]WEG09570.1 hypothetical protein PU630_03105 [Microbacterium sp. KACC 23027]